MIKINILIAIIIGFFLSGCNNAEPKNGVEPKAVSEKKSTALYDGQLVRAKLKLDPKIPLSKKFTQELKEDYLDEHFSGSKENVYIVYSKTESFYYKCKKVKKKNIANIKINGRVRYTIKQVHPIKQTVYTSDIIPYYEDATLAAKSCNYSLDNFKIEFREKMLTKTTKMLSLFMSEAEGKNVQKEIQEARNDLTDTYKSVGASFQEASHALLSPIGKFLKSGGSMTQAEAASMSASINNSFNRASRQLDATNSSFNNNSYGSSTNYSSSSSRSSSRKSSSSNISLDRVKEDKREYKLDDGEWARKRNEKLKRDNAALRAKQDNAPRTKPTYVRDQREFIGKTYEVEAGSGASK